LFRKKIHWGIGGKDEAPGIHPWTWLEPHWKRQKRVTSDRKLVKKQKAKIEEKARSR
jgi:hypothetical protein